MEGGHLVSHVVWCADPVIAHVFYYANNMREREREDILPPHYAHGDFREHELCGKKVSLRL